MPTSSGIRVAAWNVVVVPFPYSDRLAEKRRPALVVSSPQLSSFGLVWLAMITSSDNESWACDVPIADLRGAGLPSPSVIRPAKIACIEPGRILRRAGKLDNVTARKVATTIGKFFAGG